MKKLMKKQKIYMLPFEIKSIRIKNIGPIKSFNTKFKKHNLIVGGNSTNQSLDGQLVNLDNNRNCDSFNWI